MIVFEKPTFFFDILDERRNRPKALIFRVSKTFDKGKTPEKTGMPKAFDRRISISLIKMNLARRQKDGTGKTDKEISK